ncbi:MAG: NAD-dependent epimerase/dehydratase family protein [Geminicoccaceae bacterium]|nr:NAD-dependent epimerase/dehydratase family protein [Geminicoccaceae bacterium]
MIGGSPTGVVAVTGAGGFIGRALVAHLPARETRLLQRRTPVDGVGRQVVEGALEDEGAVERLVEGAGAVVHLAGRVQAPDEAAFMAANAEATDRLARAAGRAGVRHFLLVSSLAAARPEVSAYARSKRAGEEAAAAALGRTRLTVLRPPAVYGPGDRATLPIFQQLARGFLVRPKGGMRRFSLLHVGDLAQAILRLLERRQEGPLEIDDGRPDGYGWDDLVAIGGAVAGRPIRLVALPRPVFVAAAAACDLFAAVSGRTPPLSRDKLGELYAPDWLASGPTIDGWMPQHDFAAGAAETMAWYRRRGWIAPGRSHPG